MKIEKQYFRHLKDIELLRKEYTDFNAVDADGTTSIGRIMALYDKDANEAAIKVRAFNKTNQTILKKIDKLLAEVEDMKSLLGKKFMDSLETAK